jgi:hypothetical protein
MKKILSVDKPCEAKRAFRAQKIYNIESNL